MLADVRPDAVGHLAAVLGGIGARGFRLGLERYDGPDTRPCPEP